MGQTTLVRRTLMTPLVVLIAGALTGTGRATALALAPEGAHVHGVMPAVISLDCSSGRSYD